METSPSGYREIEHTADWELEVWAPDLTTLLEQAARGMYALSGTNLKSAPRQVRSIRIPFSDPESLLVSFLSELLFFAESESFGFDDYTLEIQDEQLQATLSGTKLESIEKEIKAVTYHNLAILQTDRGLEVKIVFDV